MYDEYDQVINQSRFQKPAPAPQAAPVEPPPSEDKFVARFESRGSDTHYGLTPPSAQERAEMAAHFNDDDDGAAAYTTPVAEPPAIAATDLGAAKPAAQSTDNLSFGAAFKQARQSGATQFTWRGKPYSTALASEKPKPATPAPKEPTPTTEQPAPANPTEPSAPAATSAAPAKPPAGNAIIAKASAPANNSPRSIYPYNRREANEQRMNERAATNRQAAAQAKAEEEAERQRRIEAARQAQQAGSMYPPKAQQTHPETERSGRFARAQTSYANRQAAAQRDRSEPFYSVERYGGKAPQ